MRSNRVFGLHREKVILVIVTEKEERKKEKQRKVYVVDF